MNNIGDNSDRNIDRNWNICDTLCGGDEQYWKICNKFVLFGQFYIEKLWECMNTIASSEIRNCVKVEGNKLCRN